MTHRPPTPPQPLLQAIAEDLKPVRPSPQPLTLVLRMFPLAVLVSSLVLVAVGLRPDFSVLGPVLTWGASSMQFVVAIAFIWIAAHESIPVGRLPRYIVQSAVVIASLSVVFASLATFSKSPATGPILRLPPQVNEMLRVSPWIMGFGCGIGSTVMGGLLVVLLSWVFRNSLATCPAQAGALYGAGAGLAINAGWRIACPVSTPWHTLGAHGAAIIATVILGALIGRFIGNRRLHHAGWDA